MNLLLVSTYELGRQPVHVASPAALLRRNGHHVAVLDLAIEPMSPEILDEVDAVGISVPMHTAKRLADELTAEIRDREPTMPIAHYGLYAGAGDTDSDVVSIAGEYESGLESWLASIDSGAPMAHNPLAKSKFAVPDRTGLPQLTSYARVETESGTKLAGAVEATHGCRHRCRHCPLPVVYDGRIRAVSPDTVLADIDGLVDSGAEHVTFGDPDFFNAPAHNLAILEAAHKSHPELTFDTTIKVEHLLRHRDRLADLVDMNVLFVVSAFESVDDWTLGVLDKGHSRSDMELLIETARGVGLAIRPTWLPFFPWTKPGDVAGIFGFISDHDLVGATDPVQMAIRLLIPRGSLLEDHPAVRPYLTAYNSKMLSWDWEFEHQETEGLFMELADVAAEASGCGLETTETLSRMAGVVGQIADLAFDTKPATFVPRLTESWFCCAEPTAEQGSLVQIRPR